MVNLCAQVPYLNSQDAAILVFDTLSSGLTK